MQIVLNPGSPAELRLIAAFVNDLADLKELQYPDVCNTTTVITEEVVPAPAKKTRGSKSVSTAPEVVESTKAPEVAPADAGNVSAAVSTAASTEATGATASASPVSHDDLRKLFAGFSKSGKGEAAIAILGKLGHTSIKGIPEDKLVEAHSALIAL